MSFYGKVINYLTKAFGKISVNNVQSQNPNSILAAKDYDDQLEIQSDNWINISVKNLAPTGQPEVKGLEFMHNGASSVAVEPGQISINQSDISNGAILTLVSPAFDEKGHYAGETNNTTVNINIGNKAAQGAPASGVYGYIDSQDASLSQRIGYEAKGEASASGVYAYIDSKDSALSDRIGYPATDDTAASGVYDYVDKVKKLILGDDIDVNYDTLKELETWIKSHDTEFLTLSDDVSGLQAAVANLQKLTTTHSTDIATNKSNINTNETNIQTNAENIASHAEHLANNDAAIQSIQENYVTKKSLSDTISEWNVPYVEDKAYYLAGIAQEDGKIIPTYRPYSFDTTSLNFIYNEDTCDLRVEYVVYQGKSDNTEEV